MNKDHQIVYTNIFKVISGKNGSSFKYTYTVDNEDYSSTDIGKILPNCRRVVIERISELSKYNIPVVFETKNPENARILLFESQYSLFNVKIPHELSHLISEISICEN